MRYFVKFILLFAFTVLGFSGSGQEHFAGATDTSLQAAADERGTDKLSANKLYKLAGLQRAEERVNIAHNQPAPPSKQNTSDVLLHAYALELRLQDLVAQRMERSRSICLSLTIRDIIFPFHHFW